MISSRFLLFSVVLAFFIFSCSSEEDGEPVIIVEPTFSIAFNESIVDGTLTIKPNEVVQVEVTFDYGTTGETLLTITDNLSTDIGQLTWTNLNTLIGAERGILVGEFTPSALA